MEPDIQVGDPVLVKPPNDKGESVFGIVLHVRPDGVCLILLCDGRDWRYATQETARAGRDALARYQCH